MRDGSDDLSSTGNVITLDHLLHALSNIDAVVRSLNKGVNDSLLLLGIEMLRLSVMDRSHVQLFTHCAIDDGLDVRCHVSNSTEHALSDHLAIVIHAAISRGLCACDSSGSGAERSIDDCINVGLKVLGLGVLRLLVKLFAEAKGPVDRINRAMNVDVRVEGRANVHIGVEVLGPRLSVSRRRLLCQEVLLNLVLELRLLGGSLLKSVVLDWLRVLS